MDDRLFSERDVAELLDVPLGSVRFWRHRHELAYLKVGKHIRIRQSDLDAFLDARRVGATAPHPA